jgi:hypothetical protein
MARQIKEPALRTMRTRTGIPRDEALAAIEES